MVAVVLTIFLTFLVISLFGYVIHWSLHQPWTGSINQAHMTHHLKCYPPSDFLSDTYRHAGKDSTPKFFLIAAIPLILLPILLWWLHILPFHLMLVILCVEAVLGFLHDYLHDSFHIKNHWLSRIPVIKYFFDKWVKLHYLHHVDQDTNFGIFVFWMDRIFGTFKK